MGPRLVRDGFRDQRFSRARRSVEEHALRRSDREAVEQLGVLERKLDHLPDASELLLEAPDVLVGDPRRGDLGLADGLFLDRDQRRRSDLDDPLRLGRDDHERKRSAHQEHPGNDEDVPPDERPAREGLRDKALEPGTEVHPGAPRVDRGDRDRVGVRAVDALDLDAVADTDARIAPDHGLNADESLALVVGLGAAHDRRGRLAPPDLDHVPETDLQPLPGLDVQAGGP